MQHKDERSWMLHNVLAAANLPPVSTVYNVDEMSNTYALIKKRIDFGIAGSLINASCI